MTNLVRVSLGIALPLTAMAAFGLGAARAECIQPLIALNDQGVFDRSSSPQPGTVFDASRSVDFSQVLNTGCATLVDLSSVSEDEYHSVLDSGVTLNLFLDLAEQRAAAEFGASGGVDQNIVEPRAATSAFGGKPGASEWGSRVAAANPDVGDTGKPACQLAIEGLKAVACANQRDSQCNVEASYRDRCTRATDKAELGSCVIAADAYFNQCFGRDNTFSGSSLAALCDGEVHKCSAGLTSSEPDFLHAAVTASHCEFDREVKFSLQPDFRVCAPSGSSNQPKVDNEVEARDLEGLAPFGDQVTYLAAGDARLFRPTQLGGVSLLRMIRNTVAEKYNASGAANGRLPPSFRIHSDLVWDTSALCTVVEQDGNLIKHTCQSSAGTSGGPLIQLDDDNQPRLVGINLGAESVSSGAFNLGDSLRNLAQ